MENYRQSINCKMIVKFHDDYTFEVIHRGQSPCHKKGEIYESYFCKNDFSIWKKI